MGLISNGSTVFDNGSMGSGFGGSLVFIKKLTASSSASLSFVDGSSGVVLDDTYKEYLFTFKNIHPGNNSPEFQFQTSTNGGSSYGVTLTSTHFRTVHREDDSYNELGYKVMTESYHRRRGSCCGNGCLHCPYEPKHKKGNTNLGDIY